MWDRCGGIAKEKKHEKKNKERRDASTCCTPDDLSVISGTYIKKPDVLAHICHPSYRQYEKQRQTNQLEAQMRSTMSETRETLHLCKVEKTD